MKYITPTAGHAWMQKNMEPNYIAQTAEPMTDEQRRYWFQRRGDEANARGCTWCRFSVDDTHKPTMALVEGWKERPADEGPIRWQVSPSTETESHDPRT